MELVTRAAARAAGLKRYYTGVACKRGHVAERNAASTACLTCAAAGDKRRYDADPSKKLASHSKWARANPVKVAEDMRRWNKENKAYVAVKSAAWRKANPEKCSANRKAWKAANPAKTAASNSASQKRNRGTSNAATARYKARQLRATPAWADPDAIRSVYVDAAAKGLEVDHFYPLQGEFVSGLHVHTNLQLLTRKQNASKGNRYTP